MLEQLVESKNNGKETVKRAKFLGTTFVLVMTFAFSGVLWSLFAKDIGINGEQIELSTLVSPVPVPETKPQPPEPIQKQPKSAPQNQSQVASRQTNMLRLDESPKIPNEISTVQNTQKARPNGNFHLNPNGIEKESFSTQGNGIVRDNNNFGGDGIGGKTNSNDARVIDNKVPPPPPIVKKPVETDNSNKVLSLGVINGKAQVLPKPSYSAAAKSINASGEVSVQITIDESGNVISARAVSGHPILRMDSEKAARNAKFSPTLLSNKPVKVTGVIVYKFTR